MEREITYTIDLTGEPEDIDAQLDAMFAELKELGILDEEGE